MRKPLKSNRQLNQITSLFSLNQSELKKTAQKVLELAKNFETKYPKYTNLKTFHSLTIPNKNLIKF